MNFSIRRVNALVTKEFRDFYKNPNVLFMTLIPIAVTILYKKLLGGHGVEGYLLGTCISMNISTIGCMVIAMLIAEEKEKNTLRTLMLSPLTAVEFIAGKFVITGIIVMLINIFIFFMLQLKLIYLPVFIIITLLTTISVLFIGGLIGIFSKDQMQTGTIGTPFYMILFMLPMLSKLSKIVEDIANVLPTYHCGEAISKIISGQGIWAARFNILALVLWIAGAFIVFNIVYKRNRMEE